MPFIKANYPDNWKSEIVPRIRARDNYQCVKCGVADRAVGYRDDTGQFHQLQVDAAGRILEGQLAPKGRKVIRIILTTAHLDHKLVQHSDENLASMCQRCHLNYDRPSCDRQRQASRKYGAVALRLTDKQYKIDL